MSEENNIKNTIEAVTGLVESIPVYEDLARPAAQELGKSLQTISQVINVGLSPLKGLVWGYDRIATWLHSTLEEKLATTDKDNIVSPNPSIAVPAIEALRYTASDEILRELFANLIAAAMDKKQCSGVHPAFVEIIKQLSPLDAQNLKAFGNVANHPIANYVQYSDGQEQYTFLEHVFLLNKDSTNLDANSVSIVNLQRLGLVSINYSKFFNDDSYVDFYKTEMYKSWEDMCKIRNNQSKSHDFPIPNLEVSPEVKESIIKQLNSLYQINIQKGIIELTSLGAQFKRLCIKE